MVHHATKRDYAQVSTCRYTCNCIYIYTELLSYFEFVKLRVGSEERRSVLVSLTRIVRAEVRQEACG